MKFLKRNDNGLKYGLLLKRIGQILVYTGPLIYLGTMDLLEKLFPSLNDFSLLSILLFFVALPGIFLSVFLPYKLIYLGKQYEAKGKAAQFQIDSRKPVVYLRPFFQDETSGKLIRSAIFGGQILPVLFSIEEQLAEAVNPIGPLVAIGRPGEQLPTPGAVRYYFSDTRWQDMAKEWFLKARVIILRPGMSEGIWWEFKQAFAARTADTILLLVLKMKQADYLVFSQLFRTQFDINLPDFKEISRWRSVSGFIGFNETWQAHFLPLKAPVLRKNILMPLKASFNHALQPVFIRLGIDWFPSPFSKGNLFFLSILLFIFFSAFLMYLISSNR